MGRIRSLASLTKAVEYATARQTYYSTPRPGKTTVETNPKDTVIYVASSFKVGTAAANVQVQASAASIAKFGTLAALGLSATAQTLSAPLVGLSLQKFMG